MSRYAAFISYSHADTRHARWLHHALETYRIPKKLVGIETPLGPAPRRLAPIFRDRDELPASGDLGAELRSALAASAFQVVLCSERAATSHWVNEEILAFKRIHGEHRTLALIVRGEPYDAERECFPPALRFKLGADGELSGTPAEPIAADVRPGGDGRRLASLKIMAALTGLPLDALVQRDAARRQRRLALIAAGALGIAAVTMGLAIYANSQRIEAVRQRTEADRQRDLANSSLDFLVNTFKIANPATENPRTITAITILDRVSRRAGGTELKAKPDVSARLLGATGEIYANLGLGNEAERDLDAALALTPVHGNARAAILLKLAALAYKRQDLARMQTLLDQATRTFDARSPDATLLRARLAGLNGLAAYAESNYSVAAERLSISAALFSRAPGDHNEERGRALMNEGNALVRTKHFAEADRSFRAAEGVFLKAFGANHVLTGTAFQNRAVGAFEAGRLDEAETMLDRALKTYRRVLDPDHPTTGDALILKGRIAHARKDYRGADAAFDAAIAMFTRLYGADSGSVGDAAFYKAEAQSDSGRPDPALAAVALAQRSYDKTYGAVDPEQVELANLRAQVLRAAGRIVDARRACDHAVDVQARLDPQGSAPAQAHCAALLANPARVPLLFNAGR